MGGIKMAIQKAQKKKAQKKKVQKKKAQKAPKIKSLFDHIKSITQEPYDPKYWDKLSDGDKKTFSPFMIHRFISMNPDWVEISNMFQQFSYDLSPEIVYKLYADTLPKSRIFLRYIKGKKVETFEKELVDLLCKDLQISKKEAIDYLKIYFVYPGGMDELKYIISKYAKTEKQIKNLLKRK